MSANNQKIDNNVDAELLKAINSAMEGVDFESVDPDAAVYATLPDGYFLVSVKKYEFGFSKNSGNLQVAMQLKIEENGVDLTVDKYNNVVLKELKNTKNRTIFKYYTYTSEDKILRFANDMAKFEDAEGNSLLGKEAFMNGAEILLDSLDLLVQSGSRIYVKQETTQNSDGTSSTWTNPISWKAAKKLELPA